MLELFPPAAPSMPTRPIEAKVESRDCVSLEWGPPQDDGGSPITGYVVEKREALRMSWSRAEKVAGPVTKAKIRNLVEGNDFLFRVAAVNKEGTSDFLEMDRPIKVKSPYSKFWLLDLLHVFTITGTRKQFILV